MNCRAASLAYRGSAIALLTLIGWASGPVLGFAQNPSPTELPTVRRAGGTFADELINAANERTQHRVEYDGRYLRLDYPGGDVPSSTGVCTDVVIRAYRAVGIDLQRAVHEDMRAHFSAYPRHWGLTHPDPNIDHRRVPNLRVFFARHGESLPTKREPSHYKPGDLVTWNIDGRLPHIGIVVDGTSRDGQRPLVVHNIGRGPRKEDVLFAYPITGHFRFGEDFARRIGQAQQGD